MSQTCLSGDSKGSIRRQSGFDAAVQGPPGGLHLGGRSLMAESSCGAGVNSFSVKAEESEA